MNSVLSIKYSLFSLVLTIAITILSLKINKSNTEIIYTTIGILALAILTLSIIGLIKALKSYKETKKFQVIFAFVINLFFLVLYAYLIISNI